MLFYYGCSKSGVVPVPLNYRLAPPEWQFIVADAGAKLLIAAGDFAAAIDGVRDELPSVKTWLALGDAPRGWDDWEGFLGSAPTTRPDRLALGHQQTVIMPVGAEIQLVVLDDQQLAEPDNTCPGVDDFAIGHGHHGVTSLAADVYALMHTGRIPSSHRSRRRPAPGADFPSSISNRISTRF